MLEHSGAHIDSRPGRDTSLHPEIPLCNEAGGGGIGMPTTLVEEYGKQTLTLSLTKVAVLECGGGQKLSGCWERRHLLFGRSRPRAGQLLRDEYRGARVLSRHPRVSRNTPGPLPVQCSAASECVCGTLAALWL